MAEKIELEFVGERDAQGQPLEYWGIVPETGEAVPARDLDANDLRQLSPRTIEIITGPRAGGLPPLYRKPGQRERATAEAPAKDEPKADKKG